MFHISVVIIHYSCHITEAGVEVGIPLNGLIPPKCFCADRSKAALLLWFLVVACSCCPCLCFGSAVVLVTYCVNFG